MVDQHGNGATNGGNGVTRLNMQFGPAFFAVILQTIAGIVAIVFLYGQLSSTTENTKEATKQLYIATHTEEDRTNTIVERLVKVETTLGGAVDNIKELGEKIDKIPRRP